MHSLYSSAVDSPQKRVKISEGYHWTPESRYLMVSWFDDWFLLMYLDESKYILVQSLERVKRTFYYQDPVLYTIYRLSPDFS